MPRSLRRRCNFVVNSSTFTSHCSTTFTLSRAHVLFSSTICYTFNTCVCISSPNHRGFSKFRREFVKLNLEFFISTILLSSFSSFRLLLSFSAFKYFSQGGEEKEKERVVSFFFFTWTLEGGALIETRRGGSCRSFPS